MYFPSTYINVTVYVFFFQGYNEQVENAGHALLNNIDKVRGAAKSEAENLGHSITQMSSYFDPMVNAAISSASNMLNR